MSNSGSDSKTTVSVYIPTALQRFVGDQESLDLSGATVKELLDDLVTSYGELKPHLFTDEGDLRSFVNVFINDEDIRSAQGLETPVQDQDTISIVPSIAGGAPDTDELKDLNRDEIQRYSRHLILPEVGMEGQKKLKNSSVLMIGTGGLGSPLGLYLASAGVGRIGLVEFDVVDYTNLQRQVIYTTDDVGRPKIEVAKERLQAINPFLEVDTHETRLSSENALDIIKDYDIVVDGTDNFPTRYLVNDACVLLGKPNVYGSIFRFEGQASVFDAKNGPCYRCLYPEPPPPGLVPSCAEGGVLGILPGIIGVIQATETIKLLLDQGENLTGRLLLFNALKMRFRELKLRKAPECPLCGDNPTIKELIDYEEFCGIPDATMSAQEQVQETSENWEITVEQLQEQLQEGKIKLIDVRESHEYDICNIEGATLIPLSEIESRYVELHPEDDIVLHCKMGGRSMKALNFLRSKGFTKLKSVAGGITEWAQKIDPSMPTY